MEARASPASSAASSDVESDEVAQTTERDEALMSAALRAAAACAGTGRVGVPARVADDEWPPIWGSTALRIEFSHHRGGRVCPVTRKEHASHGFFVTLGVDEERTGLPAFFVYCKETRKCNPLKRHLMLAFVDPGSYADLGVNPDDRPDLPTTMSILQAVGLLGEMKESVDRLIENPGGPWATIEGLGNIACALCTAASKHAAALALAREMLDQLVAASMMSEQAVEHAKRGFQHAKTAVRPLDPLMTLRGLAEGLAGRRE